MRSLKRLALVLALSGGASGCSAGGEPTATTEDTLPAQQTLGELLALDYLPWDFRETGCLERGYLVSMELAARGILTARVELRTRTDGDRLLSDRGDKWSFHVAPAMRGEDGRLVVLDLALERTPLDLASWVKRVNTTNVPADLTWTQAPQLDREQSRPLTTATELDVRLDRETYPRFSVPTIARMQRKLGLYISLESERGGASPEQEERATAKKARLDARVAELKVALAAAALLDEPPPDGR